jgi:hypothetical protein
VKIRSLLVGEFEEVVSGNSKAASVNTCDLIRKSEYINIKFGSHKNFKGLLKIKESL